MFSPDFYRCDMCGNVVWLIHDSSVPIICCGECCGEPMRRLVPGETDGTAEKHVPFVTQVENSLHVQIGTIPHPATDSHRIEWIALHTDKGMYVREVPRGENPVTDFVGPLGRPVAVYAYCNLHGLWKVNIRAAV